MITSKATILDLGGPTAVASALSIDVSTVSHWQHRGIPATRWLEISKLAEVKGCEHITLEALASAGASEEAS